MSPMISSQDSQQNFEVVEILIWILMLNSLSLELLLSSIFILLIKFRVPFSIVVQDVVSMHLLLNVEINDYTMCTARAVLSTFISHLDNRIWGTPIPTQLHKEGHWQIFLMWVLNFSILLHQACNCRTFLIKCVFDIQNLVFNFCHQLSKSFASSGLMGDYWYCREADARIWTNLHSGLSWMKVYPNTQFDHCPTYPEVCLADAVETSQCVLW